MLHPRCYASLGLRQQNAAQSSTILGGNPPLQQVAAIQMRGIRSARLARRPGQRLAAAACLFALLLMYSPLVAALHAAPDMSCCATAQCPAKRPIHSPVNGPVERGMPPADSDSMPGMNCAGFGDVRCSMSCCHPRQQASFAPFVFVPGVPFVISVPPGREFAALTGSGPALPGNGTPLPPPPRSVS